MSFYFPQPVKFEVQSYPGNKNFKVIHVNFRLPEEGRIGTKIKHPLLKFIEKIDGVVEVSSRYSDEICVTKGTVFSWEPIMEQIYFLLNQTKL